MNREKPVQRPIAHAAAVVVLLFATIGLAERAGADIKAAVSQAKRTGRPLFVVGITEQCPFCALLRRRLATEPQLKRLISGYVATEIDVTSPDWKLWTSMFRPTDGGVPYIFIVSATGRVIAHHIGMPKGQALDRLLETGLQRAGAPPPPKVRSVPRRVPKRPRQTAQADPEKSKKKPAKKRKAKKTAKKKPQPAEGTVKKSSESEEDFKSLAKQVRAYFAKEPAERSTATFDDKRYAALGTAERKRLRELAWKVYRRSAERKLLAKDYENLRVKAGKYTMRFTLEKRGEKPDGGWPVVIALHGGGGAPKQINDAEWRRMQKRYRVDDCLYVCPRAPTDEWNGFYTDYVYSLFVELIRMLKVFEDVNPDRVYLMGYSHGGYGSFTIGPKMPDLFAAVHSSAAAPTDGQTAPENLMHLRFTCMVGGFDKAHGRLKRCKAFGEAVQKLKSGRKDIYPVQVILFPKAGHTGLPDLKMPAQMLRHRRKPAPQSLHWELTDKVVERFYWLEVDKPGKKKSIRAECENNRVTLTTKGVDKLTVYLDHRLIDVSKPVKITAGRKTVHDGKVTPRLSTLCRTLAARGDPNLAFDVAIEVSSK